MATYFFDSSAAVKSYVTERGTAWLIGLLDPIHQHELVVGRVTGVEVAAALFRRVRAGTLPAGDAANAIMTLRRDIQQTYRVLEFTPIVADVALTVAERHALRGYDCVQLATALLFQASRVTARRPPPILVSADVELNAAAQAEGLPVEDPNNYP